MLLQNLFFLNIDRFHFCYVAGSFSTFTNSSIPRCFTFVYFSTKHVPSALVRTATFLRNHNPNIITGLVSRKRIDSSTSSHLNCLFGRRQSPGVEGLKVIPYVHIGSFLILQPRELSRRPTRQFKCDDVLEEGKAFLSYLCV